MTSRRVAESRVVLACAVVMASVVGCTDEGAVAENVEVASDATVCSVRSAGAPWWNASFAQQTGRFHVEVTATPSASNIDAVIGLSRGVASRWTQLAAIVRFAPNGVIDVRSGNTYAADFHLGYAANTTYQIRFDIDVRARTYSVGVRENSEARYAALATNYPFRTEQAGVTALDNAAVFLEPSRAGSLTVCGLRAVQDDTTADGCVASTASGGFFNAALPQSKAALVARFSATPTLLGMDGVIGFTHGRADDYNDFAASVRFYTNGLIEARNGDTYGAINPVRYIANHQHHFVAVIDVASHTYSVFVENPAQYGEFIQIAHAFKFRTQQAGATAIDNLATIVASGTGKVTTCHIHDASPPGLRAVRANTYTLAAANLDGTIALSDDNRTQLVDTSGRTFAEFPAGGVVAFDTGDKVYIGKTRNNVLTVHALGQGLAPRWERTFYALGPIQTMGAYVTGDLAVAMGNENLTELLTIRSDGTEASRMDLSELRPVISIGRSNVAIAYPLGNGMAVEALSPTGQRLWQRSFSGDFFITGMARGEDDSVAFTGQFSGPVDFGAGVFEPYSNPESSQNTFVVSLAHDGSLRFAKRLFTSGATGISTNGRRVAVAATDWTQFPYMELYVFDAAGNQLPGYLNEHMGMTGTVLVGHDDRVHANVMPRWHPSALSSTWPMFFSLSP